MNERRETEELARMLGLPSDLPRLDEAMTHPSYVNENPGACDYQRLEFLGDSVLGLCVSELLLVRMPGAGEGKLTRMRAALVNTTALAAFARSVELGRHIRVGRGAAVSGEGLQPKVLADVVEAIVGAAFLWGDLTAARRLTRVIVGESLSSDIAARDPKSKLQERVQQHGSEAPTYHIISIEGPDHDRTFEVEVQVGGQGVARGRGRTKKQAEQEAARQALTVLRTSSEDAQ